MEENVAKTGNRWVEFKHNPNHFLFNAKLQTINKASTNHWSEYSYSWVGFVSLRGQKSQTPSVHEPKGQIKMSIDPSYAVTDRIFLF